METCADNLPDSYQGISGLLMIMYAYIYYYIIIWSATMKVLAWQIEHKTCPVSLVAS